MNTEKRGLYGNYQAYYEEIDGYWHVFLWNGLGYYPIVYNPTEEHLAKARVDRQLHLLKLAGWL